jgi:hypothetical protein
LVWDCYQNLKKLSKHIIIQINMQN